MGYEIQKVFELNRINEKPIGIHKYAILLKDDKNKVLQLKMQNNSKQIIKNVAILIKCYDKKNNLIENQKFIYNNLFVPSGEIFGDDVAIMLNSAETESVEIEFEKSLDYFENTSQKIKKKNSTKISIIILIAAIILVLLIIMFVPMWLTSMM